jgi:putative ABC transport system substrate-binding protein
VSALGRRTAAAIPAIGKAEPGSRVPIVGVLRYEPPEPAFAAFREKFRELGYEEGHNVRLENPVDRCAARAASRAGGGIGADEGGCHHLGLLSPHTRSDRRHQADPDRDDLRRSAGGGGYVTNLSHPGGNVTEVAGFTCETCKAAAAFEGGGPHGQPHRGIAEPDGINPNTKDCAVQETQRAARQTGVEVLFFLRADDDPVPAFKEMIDWRADALLHIPSGVAPWVQAMIAFAAERRLPMMVTQRHWVEAGGLMTYVPDRPEMYRRVAVHVDRS